MAQNRFEQVFLHLPTQQIVIHRRFRGVLKYFDRFLIIARFATHMRHFQQSLVLVAGIVFSLEVVGRLLVRLNRFFQMLVLRQHVTNLFLQFRGLPKPIRIQIQLNRILVTLNGSLKIDMTPTFTCFTPRLFGFNLILCCHVALRCIRVACTSFSVVFGNLILRSRFTVEFGGIFLVLLFGRSEPVEFVGFFVSLSHKLICFCERHDCTRRV
mmetsp:Transcript_25993/g.42487  ORF Transcript_25993/g.42487 Transcript_25993/m.42487 type:complete len:212 (+) Transcript_25993:721-1356(+)